MATRSRSKPNDLFTALGHPLRRQILRTMIAKEGETSPRRLSKALSEPLSALSYHVRVLAECKAIEMVRTERVRGSTQHFYRPTVKAGWARQALKAPEGRAKKKRAQGEEKG